ncbi:ABC transporter ATP-binding protein [bacterium]|nr:ABC transporter ATP-binding protein [bacterium]
MRLKINQLHKAYDENQVLKGLTYEFEKGKIYGIVGRNGAGKTTLFNCINRDLAYEQGRVTLVDGGVESELTFEETGMVSASPILPEYLTGYEFISYFLSFNDSHSASDEAVVDGYFDLFSFQEQDRHKLIKNYSYGMKNKLQLLCCLIRQPNVILLDEPLSSFDIIVSHDIKERLVEMKPNHIILMSTHILQLATDVSDEILLLKNGVLTGFDWKGHQREDYEQRLMDALHDEDEVG